MGFVINSREWNPPAGIWVIMHAPELTCLYLFINCSVIYHPKIEIKLNDSLTEEKLLPPPERASRCDTPLSRQPSWKIPGASQQQSPCVGWTVLTCLSAREEYHRHALPPRGPEGPSLCLCRVSQGRVRPWSACSACARRGDASQEMTLTLLRLPRASLLLLLLLSVMSARALDLVDSHPPELICSKVTSPRGNPLAS